MTMKPVFVALLLAAAVAAHAQQVPATPAGTKTPPGSTDRAEHLTTQMARDLHLNGYQASRLRAINTDKVAKLQVLERQYANDPKTAAEKSQVISQERDQELQAVLTTDQYTEYFDARKRYAQADQNYAHNASASILINSVQNPTPARANDATIGPAKTKDTTPRSNEPFGRTLRQ